MEIFNKCINIITKIELVDLALVGDREGLLPEYSRMDPKALREAGITEGLVRLSVGMEDPEDLFNDLSRALHRSQK